MSVYQYLAGLLEARRLVIYAGAAGSMLVSCGGPGPSSSSGGGGAGGAPSCSGEACPAGIYPVCETPEAQPTACCSSGASVAACRMPAGILFHGCPASPPCASDICALSPRGAVTCCAFSAPPLPPNPCDTPVP